MPEITGIKIVQQETQEEIEQLDKEIILNEDKVEELKNRKEKLLKTLSDIEELSQIINEKSI